MNKKLITIVGAGAAGIGMAVTLKRLGIEDFQVIDKGNIGQSFREWNAHTRFITPSFNTTGFGFPDLNAITPGTSPGLFIQKEHLSGQEYAIYLREVAEYFEINVRTHEKIKEIKETEEGFELIGETNRYQSKYLIMAVGEVGFPKIASINGAELGVKYSELGDYSQLIDAPDYAIVGGNESGFDAAIQLAKQQKKSTIYTSQTGIDSDASDPSQGLSIYTKERYQEAKDFIKIKRGVRISEIRQENGLYHLLTNQGDIFASEAQPIIATGFQLSESPLINSLFDNDDDRVNLTEIDESTKKENVFMVGPKVIHNQAIFCFIYKFRQRFAVIVDEIASREGITLNEIEFQEFLENQMYLQDLSCCDTDCVC